jgi:hypothetical protein
MHISMNSHVSTITSLVELDRSSIYVSYSRIEVKRDDVAAEAVEAEAGA